MKCNNEEVRFIESMATLARVESQHTKLQDTLAQWLQHCEQYMLNLNAESLGLTQRHSLVHSLQQLPQLAKQNLVAWQQAKHKLAPVLELADFFADKVMLLVFGKFNAGKSSFCNWVAERFKFYEQTVQHFVVEQGQVRFHNQSFQEGSTETTAHIQGVVLADRLVLLDTPGLHSMTTENAELTQLFIESADGVLWLSSSTSPGQTQELAELAQELRRGKALLPIITRSDYLDEVVVGMEIKKQLCNKSEQNRAEQETDVWLRAQDKLQQMQLDARLVQSPLSISVYCAREHGKTSQALEQAGFFRLYAALLNLLEPVLAYKVHKGLAVEQHYTEEQVMPVLVAVQQRLRTLRQQLEQEQQQAVTQMQGMKDQLWRQCMATVPAVLDRYTDQERGAVLLAQALYQMLNDQVRSHAEAELDMYQLDVESLLQQAQVLSQVTHLPLTAEHYEKNYLFLEKCLLEQLELHALNVAEQVQQAIQPSIEALRQQEELLELLLGQYAQIAQQSELAA